MKALTMSMMIAAAVAMAAPSTANARPLFRSAMKTKITVPFGPWFQKANRLRKVLKKAKADRATAMNRVARLRAYKKKLLQAGKLHRAKAVDRAIEKQVRTVKRLHRRVQRLQRMDTVYQNQILSRLTVKNVGRRPMALEIRMGWHPVDCTKNPLVARKVLRSGQAVTKRARGRVICYRQISPRFAKRHRTGPWTIRTVTGAGSIRLLVKKQRRRMLPKRFGYLHR